jgi:hypothetical protein
MKYSFIILILMLVAACANIQSPFLDGSADLQKTGATQSADPERVLGASYVTIKALRAGTKKDYVYGLADALDAAASGGMTNGMLEGALKTYVAKHAKYPEDKILANYFIAKLAVKTDRVALPLSPEQKRILNLYAETITDTARDFDG